MTSQVVSGAMVKCTMGTLSCSLVASAENVSCATPAAEVEDFSPANIPSFGICISPTNPAVVAAQGAPAPCVPVLQPWTPGATRTRINGVAALDEASTTVCKWAGVVSVSSPGQFRVTEE